MDKISSSEITPEHLFFSRRQLLVGAGLLVAGALAGGCGAGGPSPRAASSSAPPSSGSNQSSESLTSYEAVTGYNNFYEFSLEKEDVAALAKGFKTTPWTIEVGGMVNRPRTYGIEDILKTFAQEERIYRFRCVEAWSMVIPWTGFPLAKLLEEAEPAPGAKYVRFQTLFDPQRMAMQQDNSFDWPYIEGLRLDEAMHDLTLLATGLYGKPALPQNGAPIRLVVPWKYGFKSIKSIVKIDLVADMPVSFWMAASPDEYGFYSNVNPDVPHPRWPQSTERRIGELGRRRTMPFNGYAEQVASLYAGMDLRKNF
ncbi:MAG: protein-methionine-sulfoxide reductase catalytic subunit MsrP [Chloroflexi bacterium]|nr:protein-methionine-sulfoxide reductase catalytic subunit MsrP [Chloroflexota bacterium]